jgi:hypothetical protein
MDVTQDSTDAIFEKQSDYFLTDWEPLLQEREHR